MSVRVDKIESDVLSELGRSIGPAGWWGRRRAPEEQAARDADKLLNEFGKDAYWLACLGERRSSGERARHWHAVAAEIERRTGRRSPATPGKTTGSLRAALNQLYVPPDADLPRLDAYHAGAPDDRYSERSRSHGRDRDASQIPEERFDRHQEDYADSASAAWDAQDHGYNSDLGVALCPDNEERCDDPSRKKRRRGLATALALIAFATVGTAGAYTYRTYYVAPRHTQTAASSAEKGQPAVRGYAVQVSARRSKADAEASFRSLQSKFPRQLGGRTAMIERADLGAKGIYFRAMVGPFASAGAADQFCGSLKAAGGQCTIQRN
jgi:sporulation related protein